MTLLRNLQGLLNGNRRCFTENGLCSRVIACYNEPLGQNWVKIVKRIISVIVQSGFTNEYKKIDRSVSASVFFVFESGDVV